MMQLPLVEHIWGNSAELYIMEIYVQIFKNA